MIGLVPSAEGTGKLDCASVAMMKRAGPYLYYCWFSSYSRTHASSLERHCELPVLHVMTAVFEIEAQHQSAVAVAAMKSVHRKPSFLCVVG